MAARRAQSAHTERARSAPPPTTASQPPHTQPNTPPSPRQDCCCEVRSASPDPPGPASPSEQPETNFLIPSRRSWGWNRVATGALCLGYGPRRLLRQTPVTLPATTRFGPPVRWKAPSPTGSAGSSTGCTPDRHICLPPEPGRPSHPRPWTQPLGCRRRVACPLQPQHAKNPAQKPGTKVRRPARSCFGAIDADTASEGCGDGHPVGRLTHATTADTTDAPNQQATRLGGAGPDAISVFTGEPEARPSGRLAGQGPAHRDTSPDSRAPSPSPG